MSDVETDPVADLVTEASEVFTPTQAELARRLGVQPLALTQWRGGKRRPSPATIRKMAQELVRQSDELRYLALQLEALAEKEKKRKRRKSAKRRRAEPRAIPKDAGTRKEDGSDGGVGGDLFSLL